MAHKANRMTLRQVLPSLAYAEILNQAYIVAMFVVVIMIGALGFFALERGQKSGDLIGQSFLLAKDATAMGTALDQEYAELLGQIRRPKGALSDRFVRGSNAFNRAHAAARRDAGPALAPLLTDLAPSHSAFVSASRAIVRATTRGDRAEALRINADTVRPAVSKLRAELDTISAESFRASSDEDEKADRFSYQQRQLIVQVTVIGVLLMIAIALVIQRYKRSAEAAATAVVIALQKAALTDHLTGLGNNRAFFEDYERETARAKRYDHPVTLALIDVDDFKAVNDTSGHPQGDRAYRIGGDEFAVILVETAPLAASLVLARLQADIRAAALASTASP